MSSESKRVKLLTLIELFLGLAGLVGGIVVAVMGALEQSAGFLIAGEGLATMVFGGRGALIANVPARIGKLASLAIVVVLLQLACVAACVAIMGTDEQSDFVAIACCAVPAVVALVIWLLSRGMAKRAER